jgi:hypothetical protein
MQLYERGGEYFLCLIFEKETRMTRIWRMIADEKGTRMTRIGRMIANEKGTRMTRIGRMIANEKENTDDTDWADDRG